MIKVIKKGRHRSWPPSVRIWWDKRKFQKDITFHESCRYQAVPDGHINKLMGFGYAPWWKAIFIFIGQLFLGPILWNEHHKDSARIGWRYAPQNDKIEILTYCYVNKVWMYQHLCYVDFNKEIEYSIFCTSTTYQFVCGDNVLFEEFRHNKKFQFALGFYFGGQSKAPHEMKISIRWTGARWIQRRKSQ